MKEFILKYKFVIIGIFVLSAFLIGGTYAWINIELFGEKTNRIVAGSLVLELDESTCTGISVVNGYPISDEEGMKQVACTFSVENTGTIASDYSVYVDDLDLEVGEERMSDSDVSYGLIKNNGNAKINLVSSLGVHPNRVLTSTKLDVGGVDTYELRFWIDSDASVDAMGKIFYTNLRIVGNIDQPKPVISNISDYYVYGTSEEVDLAGDGSVVIPSRENSVRMTDEFSNAVLNNTSFTDSLGNTWNSGDPLPNPGIIYEVSGVEKTVEAMSGMFFNIDAAMGIPVPSITLDFSLWDTDNIKYMDYMFMGSNATKINLNGFDTSNVVDMNYMFYAIAASNLDVSSFDTSKVTDMSNMFASGQTTSLDVSGFDTGSVTDMSSMFANTVITTLDVSSFDTSIVTNMSSMFKNSATTTLDVSSFDTSVVTNMSRMFYNSQATSLDVSGFNTSNVTDMSSMFYYSIATTLDVSEFNTTKVVNMSSMFDYSVACPVYVINNEVSQNRFLNEGSLSFEKVWDNLVLPTDEEFALMCGRGNS